MLVALVAVGAGVAATVTQEASFTATMRLIITPLPQDDQTFLGTSLIRDTGEPARTAANAAEGLAPRAVAVETARRLGAGWSAASVDGAVRLKPATSGNVVDVAARASSRGRATRLANTFAAATLSVRWRTIARELDARTAAFGSVPGTSDNATGRDREIIRATRRAGRDPTLRLEGTRATVSEDGIPALAVLVLVLLGGLFLGALAAVGLGRLQSRVEPQPRSESPSAPPDVPLPPRQREGLTSRPPASGDPPPRREPTGVRFQSVTVTLPDGARLELADGATGADAAAAISDDLARVALGVRVDGELRDLSAPLADGAAIELVTPTSRQLVVERTPSREGGAVGAFRRLMRRGTSPSGAGGRIAHDHAPARGEVSPPDR